MRPGLQGWKQSLASLLWALEQSACLPVCKMGDGYTSHSDSNYLEVP